MSTPQLHCLICQVSIIHAHLGIDSCRACATFYKRTLNRKRPLKCKRGANDCLREDATISCRKCRFQRFKKVFEKAYAGEWQQKVVISGSSEMQSEDDPPQSFLDHNSFFNCEPSCSDTPHLDQMKKAYSMLCLVRKSAEIGTLPHRTLHNVLKDDKIMPYAAKYSAVISHSRTFFSGLIDFARASFDDFESLSAEKRHFIVYSNFKLIQLLELTYRAFQHFPNDDTLMCSYMTFLNKDTVEEFWDDCTFDIYKKEWILEFKKSKMLTIKSNKSQFKRVRPSGEEFVALVGLALWKETTNMSAELLNTVNRNRTGIMSELHKMYARSGLTNYAARLGDLLCLLANVEGVNDFTNEDLQVFRLMNLFSESP